MSNYCRWVAACGLLIGCGGDGATMDMGEPPPPPICKTPTGTPAQPWFTEITAEVGLAPSADLTPLGTIVTVGDFDGDGFPDMVSSIWTAMRETPGGMRGHFLFMNRPNPSGAGRVFVDATADSGIMATRDGVGGRCFGGSSAADLDNDGDIDLILCNGPDDTGMLTDACDAFLNDGSGHFTLAPSSGLDRTGPFWEVNAVYLDFDHDGVIDFLPGTMADWPNDPGIPNVGPKLFKGIGDGTFSDVATQVGLPDVDGDEALDQNWPTAMNVLACDIDSDGDDDLIYTDYGRIYNQAFIYDGGKFTEKAIPLGIASDDRVDYSDDESYRCWCQAHPGACPKDVPPPSYAPICTAFGRTDGRGWIPGWSDQPGHLGGNNFGITCGDIDNDGDIDLMTAEIRHGDVGSASDPSELLYNDTPVGMPLGKYRRPGNLATGLDRHEQGIFWNEGDMTPVFHDFDLDGRKDIYLASSDYPGTHGWMWHQKSDGTFEDVSTASGTAQKSVQGIAFVDLDGDGDLDLIAGTSTFRNVAPTNALRVYRNQVGQDQNLTTIKLVGLGAGHANRQGVGARVTVTAGGVTQVQEALSRPTPVLTFGLGAACTIDKLEVRWPNADHTVSTYTNVLANYPVEIHEGSSTVKYIH